LEALLQVVVERQQTVAHMALQEGARVYPKILISSEFTGAELAHEPYSAQSIRDILLRFGIPRDIIAIKSSELDELGDRNMDSPDERVRYIITKRALMEGWDCKSIYGIVMVNNIGADVTNFQLIGRGLRQPNRTYYINPDLNELHIYTNSQSHDSAVARLSSYLSDCGLSDNSHTLLVIDDSRSSHKLSIVSDTQICTAYLDDPVVFGKTYVENIISSKLDKLLIEEKNLPSPEETFQKIDLDNFKADAGFAQGRSHLPFKGSDSIALSKNKLKSFLFAGLDGAIPDSLILYHFVKKQLNLICDYKRAFLVREYLINELRNRIEDERMDFMQHYFEVNAPAHLVSEEFILSQSGSFPITVKAHPDIALNLPFNNSLIGDIPKSLFNDDELDFARHIDNFAHVKWFRNIPVTGLSLPYAFGRFYPDFVLSYEYSPGCKKTIYVETKGGHLMGNRDSEAKKSAAEIISKIDENKLLVIFGSFRDCKTLVNQIVGLSE
jgi:type III restriction enzyme